MATKVEDPMNKVPSLSDVREMLADPLAESLDPMTDEELRSAWGAEGRMRRDDIRSGHVEAVSEQVVAERVRKLVR